jgi:hypothetical protein
MSSPGPLGRLVIEGHPFIGVIDDAFNRAFALNTESSPGTQDRASSTARVTRPGGGAGLP